MSVRRTKISDFGLRAGLALRLCLAWRQHAHSLTDPHPRPLNVLHRHCVSPVTPPSASASLTIPKSTRSTGSSASRSPRRATMSSASSKTCRSTARASAPASQRSSPTSTAGRLSRSARSAPRASPPLSSDPTVFDRGDAQLAATHPPSTNSVCPVTKSDAGLERYTAAFVRSSDVARRPSGIRARIPFRKSP